MIGGASRNVGKTSLLCKIIAHFSESYQIIGLKIKTINQDDHFFHGKDISLGNQAFNLYDEAEMNSSGDSSKMLNAGALRAYRLKTFYGNLDLSFKSFLEKRPENTLIVCESNSLREFIIPDLFLLIKHKHETEMKPSALRMEGLANRIIYTDGFEHSFSLNELEVINNQWLLNC